MTATDYTAGIFVSQGQIVVTAVDVLHATGDVLILEAECRSKFPGPVTTSVRRDGIYVDFWAGPGDFAAVETPQPTTIVLPYSSVDWDVIGSRNEYTLRVVAWRKPGEERRRIYPAD